MKDKFLKQSTHEYKPPQRMLLLFCLAPLFLILLPILFVWLGAKIDHWLAWHFSFPQPYHLVAGSILVLLGLLFGMWSNYSQFTLGRGTPVPLMATQRLIVQPPYSLCRNPMSLGAICLYLGIAILFQSYAAMILVLLFAACLLTYIKLVEEKEMEIRFGQAYLEYRQRTPFLIPRLWRRPSSLR